MLAHLAARLGEARPQQLLAPLLAPRLGGLATRPGADDVGELHLEDVAQVAVRDADLLVVRPERLVPRFDHLERLLP